MRRNQSVLVLCAAFLSVIGPQRSAAQPYTTSEVLPVHSWGGFYLGANLGGAWGQHHRHRPQRVHPGRRLLERVA